MGEISRRARSFRVLTRQRITVEGGSTVGMGSKEIQEFQSWLQTAAQQLVVGKTGAESWVGTYVRAAYGRGWYRAESMIQRSALPDADRALALTVGTATELEGIVAETYRQISRVAIDAIARAANPRELAGLVADRIEKILVTRGRAMAQFSVVKAFNRATLDAFRDAGVQRVGIEAEHLPKPKPKSALDSMFVRDAKTRKLKASRRKATKTPKDDDPEIVEILTAGDDLVCQQCEDIADAGPYDIDTAQDLIPAHPNCRCAFVPSFDKRFAHDYDPDQPRDPNGQWAGGGGRGGRTPSQPMTEEMLLELLRIEREAKMSVHKHMAAQQLGEAFRDATVADEFDPNEPRDPDGKWTSGGGSGGTVKKINIAAPAKGTTAERVALRKQLKQTTDPAERELIKKKLAESFQKHHADMVKKGNTQKAAELAYKMQKQGISPLAAAVAPKAPEGNVMFPKGAAPEKSAEETAKAAWEKSNPSVPFSVEKWKAGEASKAMAAKAVAATHHMPPDVDPKQYSDKQLIKMYTGSHYTGINQGLRSGVLTENQWKFATGVNSALEKLPPHQGMVYRKVSDSSGTLFSMYKKGMIVEERGFTSTSKSQDKWHGNLQFHIQSKTGRDVEHISSHPNEREVLFRSGTRFRVLDIQGADKPAGSTKIIRMEEV